MGIIYNISNYFRSKKNKSKLPKDKIKKYKDLLEISNKRKKKKKLSPKSYKIDNMVFNIGDKVICRSNECDPLVVGKVVEFWDNNGKWDVCIPYIKNSDGKILGITGIIKPYCEKLFNVLITMKPLEQWNYFVPKENRYTKKEMLLKQKKYDNKNTFFKKLV